MKTIKFLTFSFLTILFISCGSKKTVAGPEETTTTKYNSTRIDEIKVLSEDGSKIIKIPAIFLTGIGTKNNSKVMAEESAKTRVSNSFSRILENKLTATFEEKTVSLNGQSATVIRDKIKSVTNTITKHLITGEIKTTEKDGFYTSEVEVYISGKEYKKIMSNSADEVKEKLISDEEIRNTKELFKAVDEIFEGELD